MQVKCLREELLDSKVAEYGGRIIKTTGNGVLVEFPSASGGHGPARFDRSAEPPVGDAHRHQCRRLDLESEGGAFQSSCQKASASSSMIGLLPEVIARTREEVCGSKRRM